jgi:peptide/nickel transport system substrate-binding protein
VNRLVGPASAVTVLSCCVLCGLVLTACTEEIEKDGSGVTVQYPTDEAAVGPNFDLPAQFLVFLPLVARNAKGELEGRLARSWEPSDDFLSWTVHLNTSVRWHDGVPVTASDIAFTVELLSRPDVGYLAEGDVTITVLDDSTFVYESTLDSPLDDYRTYYPKHLLDTLDPTEFYEWKFWTQPVGNGPYRYVRHVPKTMMELHANADYFRGQPAIRRVVLKFAEPQLTELLAGSVDALTSVSTLELLKLSDDERFQAYYQYGVDVEAIYWSHRSELFRDARTRRALTLAIDRLELLDLLNLPDGLPLFDVVFSQRQWNELPEPLPHDPHQAVQLLEETGWRDVDGNGVRERNGKEFAFTLLVSGTGGDRIGVYVQDQLRRVGVRAEIRTVADWATLFGMVRTGEFEAAVFGHLMDVGSVRGHLALFGTDSYLGYQSSEVSELLVAIAENGDPKKKDALFKELWPLFEMDVPATFLYPRVSTNVVRSWLRGLASPFHGDPVWYMEDLWIDDES